MNTDLLQQMFAAFDAHNLLLGIPLLVLLLIWGLRLFFRNAPKIGPWISSDAGGAILGIAGAIAQGMAYAAALPGAHKFSAIVIAVVGFLFADETFFRALKKLGIDLSIDPKPADPAPAKPVQSPLLPPGAVGILLCVCAFGLSSCAFLRPLEPKLVNCVTSPTSTVLKDVGAALGDASTKWEAKLDNLALQWGIDTVLCAIGVFVEAFEKVQATGGAGIMAEACDPNTSSCPVDNTTRLIRARSYLAGAHVRLHSP